MGREHRESGQQSRGVLAGEAVGDHAAGEPAEGPIGGDARRPDTLEPPVKPTSDAAKIKVFIKPMIMWLWIGGGLMGVGTLLSAFPGSRRRPTDPTSAPIGVSV